jgi:DNA-binding MarR family transcriptional regulator
MSAPTTAAEGASPRDPAASSAPAGRVVTSSGELTDAEAAAWRSFAHMHEALWSRIESQLQADSGLSIADYTVLVALEDVPEGGIRAIHLCERIGWEKSRLHHQLVRMCKRGLVQRRNGEKRSLYAVITPKGRAALTAAAPAHARHVREMVIDRLTPGQLEQMRVISRTILEPLVEAPESAE